MRISKLKTIFIRTLRNVSFFLHKDITDTFDRVNELQCKTNDILFYCLNNYQKLVCPFDDEYSRAALSYVRETGHVDLVPYFFQPKITYVDSGIVDSYPYVTHNGKKLYFPKSWDLGKVEWFYKNYINNERIISKDSGIGPHQYQTEYFRIESGDILVDIGCAEALLALDVIDYVKSVYLIENDPIWFEPLMLTFKDYLNKVQLISKSISNVDNDLEIKLDSLLRIHNGESIFIKMDIEGGELDVLRSSLDYIMGQSKLKFACCTYHRIFDADDIKRLFDSIGYSCSFSTGYILTSFLDSSGVPTLRRGVIRAKK